MKVSGFLLIALMVAIVCASVDQQPASSQDAKSAMFPAGTSGERKLKRLTKEWSADIDDSFRSRIDQGSLVFWRPGRTIWIDAYDDDKGTPEQRLQQIKADASKDRTDILDYEDGPIHRFAYLLHEVEEGDKRDAVYSFSIARPGYIILGIYFDKPEDKDWAIALAKSIRFSASK